jgi:hypothetical protein
VAGMDSIALAALVDKVEHLLDERPVISQTA